MGGRRVAERSCLSAASKFQEGLISAVWGRELRQLGRGLPRFPPGPAGAEAVARGLSAPPPPERQLQVNWGYPRRALPRVIPPSELKAPSSSRPYGVKDKSRTSA